MFKRISMSFLLVLTSGFICSAAMADTKIVKVPVLNVRSCPSTNCAIVTKLNKGDKVEVDKIDGDWASVTIKEKTGFAVNRSLRSSYAYLWWYVIGGIGLLLLYSRHLAREEEKRQQQKHEAFLLATKCPKCETLGAMSEAGRECIERRKSTIIKTIKTQYKDYTKTQERLVPATTYIYKVTITCSNCGHTVTGTVSEKRED